MAGVFKFKAVKPAKLKDADIRRQIRNAVFRVGRGVKRDFERSVATWSDKPKFELLTSVRQDSEPGFFVGTDHPTFSLVNEGSPEHPIYPVNATKLVFQQDYTPKTESGVIGSRVGGKSGEIIIVDQVHHPGFEGRHFDRAIAAAWEKRWKRAIEEAIRSGLRSSGHSKR